MLFIIILLLLTVIATIVAEFILSDLIQKEFLNLDKYFQRRSKMIANIVYAVEFHKVHNDDIFSKILNLEAQDSKKLDMNEKIILQNRITQLINRMFYILDSYVDLKQNETYRKVMAEYNKNDNDLSNSKIRYNNFAKYYNIIINLPLLNRVFDSFGMKQMKTAN